MQALLLAAALAGAGFVVLPALSDEEAPACGPSACIPLAPGETSLRLAAGAAYAFLDATGAPLATGCSTGAVLDVPPGAVLLRATPGAC